MVSDIGHILLHKTNHEACRSHTCGIQFEDERKHLPTRSGQVTTRWVAVVLEVCLRMVTVAW